MARMATFHFIPLINLYYSGINLGYGFRGDYDISTIPHGTIEHSYSTATVGLGILITYVFIYSLTDSLI